MNKKHALSLAFLLGFCLLFYYWWSHWSENTFVPAPPVPEVIEDVTFLHQPSSIGTKENPDARRMYEQEMLKDPATGEIPPGIRERELLFAKAIPASKSRSSLYRKAGIRESDWISAGPHNIGGRTRALALDVTNEHTILAGGVSGGLWRSDNDGLNWQKTTPPDVIQSVTALVQDTRAGKTNTWYYGTGELIGNSARGGDAPFLGNGIFKSADGGRSWEILPSTKSGTPGKWDSPFDFVFNLKINTSNTQGDEIYAACAGGIYRSTDGGDKWEASLADNATYYTDIEISPTGTMYATLSSIKFDDEPEKDLKGVFRSTNGEDWVNIMPQGWPEKFHRTVIGMNPNDENEIYFLVYSDSGNGLWRYNADRAKDRQWTELSRNLPGSNTVNKDSWDLDLQKSYNMLVKVQRGNSNVVYVGGTILYRSTTAFTSPEGTNWIGGYDTTGNLGHYHNHHADQHALVFYPSAPEKAVSGHDGGISVTSNILAEKGVSWESLNNGYKTSQFYTVGIDQSQVNDIIIGGLQDNGSQITSSLDYGSAWNRMLGGDGGYTHVAFKGAYYYMSFQNSQIYRLTLNDELKITSYARVDPPGAGQIENQKYLFVNPFVFDPNNHNRMYLAAGNVVFRNRNLSQIPSGSQQPSSLNWDALPATTIAKGSISAIAISKEPENILYYGTTTGKLYRAEKADSVTPSVQEISSPLFPSGAYNSHISVNPLNANEFVVTFSNYNIRSIFYSVDGGKSFTDISGNLEETENGHGNGPSVRFTEIIPLQNGQKLFLAGTSTGLYSSISENGTPLEWTQEGPDVVGNMVVPQMRYRSLDGRVVIATHGNGVFYRNFENVLPIDQTPAGEPISMEDPYPNPTTGPVLLSYSIPEEGPVRIRLYDDRGRIIRNLLWARQFAGESEISWDGTNANGVVLPAGTYIIKMEYKNKVLAKRIVLLR